MAMELSRLALLHFYLPEVNIQFYNDHGVLKYLVYMDSGRYTSLISKKYLILFRTQMLRIFLILSVYTVFTSFFLTALEPKSVNGGVTNQQKPTKTKKNFPLVLDLLFKTNIDCFC